MCGPGPVGLHPGAQPGHRERVAGVGAQRERDRDAQRGRRAQPRAGGEVAAYLQLGGLRLQLGADAVHVGLPPLRRGPDGRLLRREPRSP